MKNYRIVKDPYSTFEVQVKNFFGNWRTPRGNGFETIEEARAFIERGCEDEVVEFINK